MNSSSLSLREIDGIVIVDVIRGSLLLGGRDETLRKAIAGLLESGKDKILINLANVLYIDSSGVGALMTSYTRVRNHSGVLKLLSPQPKLRDMLLLIKLDRIFEIFYDEQEALRSFHTQQPV